jgi:hypothetical protein
MKNNLSRISFTCASLAGQPLARADAALARSFIARRFAASLSSQRLVSLLLLSLMAILLSGCNLADVVSNLGDAIGDSFRNALDF